MTPELAWRAGDGVLDVLYLFTSHVHIKLQRGRFRNAGLCKGSHTHRVRRGLGRRPSTALFCAASRRLLKYEPLWSTRVKGLKLSSCPQLPTTLVRESGLVPAHMKGVWELGVRFVSS
jgi:hypothetical protein